MSRSSSPASSVSTRSTRSAARRRSQRSPTAPRRSRPSTGSSARATRYVTAAKLLVSSRVGIDLPAGPSEVIVIADETADAEACAADLLAQAEHGPDSEALLLSTDAVLSERVSTLVAQYDNVMVETVASLADALARSEAFAPEHLELHVRDPEALLAGVRNAGSVFIGGSAVIGDYAAGATHVLPTGGLARSSGGLGLEMFMKPLQIVRATDAGAAAAAGVIGADRARRGPAAPRCRRRAPPGARVSTPPPMRRGRARRSDVPRGCDDEPRATHVPLRAEVPPRSRFRTASRPTPGRPRWPRSPPGTASPRPQVLKFDQNTPALPGVAQIPLGGELRDAQRVSRRDLPRAARGGGRVRLPRRRRRRGVEPDRRRRGRRRSHPALRPHLPRRRGERRRSSRRPTRSTASRRCSRAPIPSPARTAPTARASIWRCNPDNPTGVVDPGGGARRARAPPSRRAVVVDEAYVEYGGETRHPVARRVPEPDRAAHDVEGLRLRRAPRRVRGRGSRDGRGARGAASAGADLRARRPDRRGRAPRSALRPRRRSSPSASASATPSSRPGFDAPPVAGNFVWIRSDGRSRRAARAAGHHRAPLPGGDPGHAPAAGRERPLPARARRRARPARPGARQRSSARAPRRRSGSRSSLDGSGRSHVATGHRLPRPPADAARLPRRVRPRLRRRRRSRGRRAPHRRGRARRVRRAPSSRRSERARESRATARPSCRWTRPARWRRSTSSAGAHAEISLAFTGERVGGLALSLLPHALERFTMEAGCTVHVEATGADDHHVAEAAFKALGQALRQAVAAGDGGIRSTKGIA